MICYNITSFYYAYHKNTSMLKKMTSNAVIDKMAISLSVVCAIHCLIFPFIIVLLPNIAAWHINDEGFHQWILLAVLPMSIYALTMGCKKHLRFHLAIIGSLGLIMLVAAAFLGDSLLPEIWEKTLTVIAVSIITLSHYWNFKLCHHYNNCCVYPE